MNLIEYSWFENFWFIFIMTNMMFITALFVSKDAHLGLLQVVFNIINLAIVCAELDK